jgi:hypothetical protein
MKEIIEDDDYTIYLSAVYDNEFTAWRWSWSITTTGCTMCSAGYGHDNEICYPKREDALRSTIMVYSINKDVRRDMLLKHLIEI